MDTDHGDHIGLSKITTTLHLGAHTDAPNHYRAKASGISERSLNFYYGPCQVIEVSTPSSQRIQWQDLKTQDIKAPRVLFKSLSFPNPNRWNEDFCSLSPELIDELAKRHVILVGIDTPSVDPFASKALESHQQIFKYNMAILEGIVLTDVAQGLYTLSAFPLKLKGADASPVRAVLISP